MTQDFSGQNLRGRSFKDRNDLVGANFSYADIRGTDFTNAILRKANFSQAQAGRERNWATILLVVSLLLSTLSGLAFGFVGVTTGVALSSQNPVEILAAMVSLIILGVFIVVSIRQSLVTAVGLLLAIGVVVSVLMALVGAKTGVTAAVIAGTGAIAIAILAAAAGVGTGMGSVAVLAASAAVAAGLSVVLEASRTTAVTGTLAAAVAVAMAMAAAGLSASVMRKALAGDKQYTFIRKLAIIFTAIGGTNFHGADLTDADFTQATLESTNLLKANLTRTCWFQAKKLELTRVGKSYLENEQVQQLVVTGEGQKQNFDHLYLRGVNLRGANLMEASFVGADLSQANLQSTNLSRANLAQTDLDGADLTGARLAGANIEDWGITSETKFDKV